MKIGVPKEIKVHEYRVGLTPAGARELTTRGHQVLIEKSAGLGAGITDADFVAAGAVIVDGPETLFAEAEMIVKVKEPLASERRRLRPGQILYAYLHLAPDLEQTRDLLSSGATCIAYETVIAPDGSLPLLTPMSEIAGRMGPQVGAACLLKAAGGRGLLLGGVPGVEAANVVILGGGVAGTQAAKVALGMGARVTVVDRSLPVLRRLETCFGSSIQTVASNVEVVERLIAEADVAIGAVLVAGAAAPKLATARTIGKMKPGSVVVDIAIDQGGCFETSRPTTHAEPTFVVGDVVHYCVANMPGAVARTSTFALTNATLPFAVSLADKGWKRALSEDACLARGLNVHDGKIACQAVAEALGHPYVPVLSLLDA